MTVDARDDYLDLLDAALVGPRGAKRDLLREGSDHLEDATQAYVDAGYDQQEAVDMAVSDFGTVDEVAPGFQSTLAVAASRRTAWTLLAALSGQPFLWDRGLSLSTSAQASAPDGWLYALLNKTIEIGGGASLLGAVLALVATGIGNRWLQAQRRVARATAIFALAAAVLVPLNAATITAVSGGGNPLLWALIAVLLVGPLSAAGLSARSTLRAC